MPSFAYTIKDEEEQILEGNADAESEDILRTRLSEQGFTVLEIKQTKTTSGARKVYGGVKAKDLSIMCRQFSVMIDAGVSLVRSLNVLSQQVSNPKLKIVLEDVKLDVEAGNQLYKALSKYPNIFDRLFIGLIKAGEVGGNLEESLHRLSEFLESDVKLKNKIKSAMTYPTVVMVAAIVIVLVLMTFVIPQFLTMFEDLGVKELPPTTQVLKDFSDFLLTKWYLMIGIVVCAVGLWKWIASTKLGNRCIDWGKLKVPVFGDLTLKVAISRFARTLATLLSSGVPILQAMETVAGTVSNEIISDAIFDAREAIREGEGIAPPLERSKLFPPMVVHMISIGQESGALDPMLLKVADFYEDEVDNLVASLTSALEPILIIFLGGIVGFIVISVFMPIINITQTLSSDSGGD
ncbi:MAG: type II secretion system F family protein [Abditibacteriota bacterium]|nr:type II secretion system F family protein [Abditibacteriota bacterium]